MKEAKHPERGVSLRVLRKLPHFDDRARAEIRSSVKARVEDCPSPTPSEELMLLERAGMTKAELWTVL